MWIMFELLVFFSTKKEKKIFKCQFSLNKNFFKVLLQFGNYIDTHKSAKNIIFC